MPTNNNINYGPAALPGSVQPPVIGNNIDRAPAAVPPGAGIGVNPTTPAPVVPVTEQPVLLPPATTRVIIPVTEQPVDITANANVVAGPNITAGNQQRYITILANGVVVTNNATTLNFSGNGVTVSNLGTTGANIVINTSGGGITFSPVYNVVTDGLVFELDAGNSASYPGSGNNWYDLVGSDDATLPNSATYSSNNGGILTFNRSLSQSAHASSLGSALTTFTAETWVKFNNLTLSSGNATCAITEVYASTPINYAIGTGMLGNTVVWQGGYYGGAGDWHLAGNLVPVVDTWYCMAVTYDGTNVKFYVNGALNDTAASAVTPVSSGQGIHIGERWDAPYYTESYVDGSIPVVRLYNRALSAAEVFANYYANHARFVNIPPLVTDGLVLNLDAGNVDSYSGSGTIWYDLSNIGNNATLTGTTPWTSAGDQSYFTFSSGYADAGNLLPNTAYTKIGIFRVTGNYVNLMSGDNSNAHAFWGAATPYLSSGHNSNWTTVASPIVTPVNQWVFGAVTFDSTSGWKLYLNNNTVVTNPSTDQFTANPALLEVGAYEGGNNLGGDVAAALVYDRALTEAEMAQNFAHYQSRFGL